jgi:hypothetical protein
MNFQQTIASLIQSKREGDYWDFKEEPHDNNASLLHDILCLCNSLHAGERYLILGVSDPKDGCQLVGLQPGQANRKEQANLIDFLRSKKFAGDIRPEIELRTILMNNKEIDIIVIFDNPYKPYYLTDDYKDRGKIVYAFHIYGRTNDTNTPLVKSADINSVEKMWRQRFGLQLSPLERMKLLLAKPNEWFKDIGNKSVAYHIQNPEYTVTFSEVESFWEPYTLFYTNEKAFFGKASFRYHTTELFESEYMYCDEMRITLPVPQTQYIQFSDSKHWFYYYNLKELSGLFLFFLTDGNLDVTSRGSHAPFIIFRNNLQQAEFIQLLKQEEKQVFKKEPDYWSQQVKKKMTGNKESVIDALFLSRVYQFYEVFDADDLNEHKSDFS